MCYYLVGKAQYCIQIMHRGLQCPNSGQTLPFGGKMKNMVFQLVILRYKMPFSSISLPVFHVLTGVWLSCVLPATIYQL